MLIIHIFLHSGRFISPTALVGAILCASDVLEVRGGKDESCSNEEKQTKSWFEPVNETINSSHTNQCVLLRDIINKNTDIISL